MNLFKALSYKEWIKTRKVIYVLVLLSVSTLFYSFVEVMHAIRLEDANQVWYSFLFLDFGLPAVAFYFPLIAGLALALVQFLPEMVNKRLKLTLHLPADEFAIIAAMLLYGYMVLITLFIFTIIVYVAGLSILFPTEITTMLLSRLLPAYIGGLSLYGFTAWVCFEPQWKQRLLNLFVSIGLLAVLFASSAWGTYLHFTIGLLVLVVAAFAFPFYSVLRFKHGVL